MIKKIATLTIITALCAMLLCGCEKPRSNENVSQLREDVLIGSDGDLSVTVYPEMRELPLSLDGVAMEKIPVLIVKISCLSEIKGTFNVFVTIDGKEYSATPEERASKIMRAVLPVETLPKGELEVCLKGENQTIIKCTSAVNGEIADYKTALETARQTLGDKIVQDGRTTKGEFLVRVLCENKNTFWYVGYITAETSYSLLISADGMEVIAERTTETKR